MWRNKQHCGSYRKKTAAAGKNSFFNVISPHFGFNLISVIFLLSIATASADVVVQGGSIDVDSLCIGADCKSAWPSGGSSLPVGTLGQTLRHDGTNWVASSLLNNTGDDNIKIQNNNEVYLDLRNSQNGGKEYSLVSAGDTPLGLGSFSIYDKTADVSRFIIDPTGKIGIGTAKPNATLEVKGLDDQFIRVTSSNSSRAGIELFRPSDSSTDWDIENLFGNLRFRASYDDFLNYFTKMIIMGNGNVGIGTTGPWTKLHVSDPTAVTTFTGNPQEGLTIQGGDWGLNQYSLISFRASNGPSLSIAQIGAKFTGLGSYLQFGTSNNYGLGITNTAMSIDYNGNVGIGTTLPGARLDIVGAGVGSIDLKVNGRILTGDATGNGGIWLGNSFTGFVGELGNNIGFWTNGAGWNTFQINKATGNVGIGMTNPGYNLDVNGITRVNAGTNPLLLTGSYQGYPDSSTNHAEISNDVGTYKTLMIVGNKANDGVTRRVSVWDKLDVNGQIHATGDICTDVGAKCLSTSGGGPGFSSPVYSTSPGGYSQTYLHQWGLLGNGAIYIEPAAGNNLYLTDSWSRTGLLDFQFGKYAFESGNVGIGMTNPDEKLDISGGNLQVRREVGDISSAVVWINQLNIGANGKWGIASRNAGNLGFYNAGTGLDAVTMIPSGNVGIGTASPSGKLDVRGGRACITSAFPYACPAGWMQPGSLTIGDTGLNYGGGSNWNSNTAGLMMEAADNTEIAVHDAGTRVASLMYYEGAPNRITLGRDMGWGPISSVALKGNLVFPDGSVQTTASSGGSSQWTTSGSNIYYNSGNIGIGTTFPSSKLVVTSDPGVGGIVGAAITADAPGTGASDYALALRAKTGAATVNNLMFVQGDGNVGIGTTSPNDKLEINGNLRFTPSNPNIIASSYFIAPGGAYFNSGTVYTEAAIQARGGIHNDANTYLTVSGGTSGYTYFSGNVGIGMANPGYNLDVNGMTRVNAGTNPLLLTGSYQGYPDSSTNHAEISNDVGAYKTLMIVGNKANDGVTRRVSVWDKLVVNGDLTVTGTLTKGAGAFEIENPIDQNKILRHSFVESPDMKNIYDGIAILDDKGEAIVNLPNYFEALNKDFRYQLTPINHPAPGLYIKETIKNNLFTIAGGDKYQEVSWQVTGTRHDKFAQEHPIVVVENK